MNLTKLTLAACIGALAQQAHSAADSLEKTVIDAETAGAKDNANLIDVITIDREAINNIEDTVRHLPGVQVNDTGNRFGDNGFNIRGVEGDAVAITIDGLAQGETLNPPTFAPYGMFGANRNSIDVELVKEIEIVKGPDSVRSGSGALGGAVTYTTKDPRDILKPGADTGVELKAGFDGRSDERLLSAAFAQRLDNWEALLIYANRDGSEIQAHDSGENITGAARGQANPLDKQSDALLAKLIYYIDAHQRVGLLYENSERETTGELLSRESAIYYNFNSFDEFRRERVGLFYEFTQAGAALFDSLSASLTTQELFNRGETAFSYDPSFGTDGDTGNDILRIEDRGFTQDTWQFNLDFSKRLEGAIAHELVYGLAYQDSGAVNALYDIRYATVSRGSEQTQHLRDPSWVPKTDKTVIDIYALDRMPVSDALSFDIGVRYTSTEYSPDVDENFTDPLGVSVGDTDFNATTAQAGVEYHFHPRHRLSARLAQGYKAPTTQELYLGANSGVADGLVDTATGATFEDWEAISNPDLEAEKATSLEIAYRWTHSLGDITLTAFTTNYDDRIESVALNRDLGQSIVTGDDQVTDVDEYTQVQNVGEMTIDGFELEGRLRFTDALALTFGYSHIDGEHDTTSANVVDAEDHENTPNHHDKGDAVVSVSPDSAVLGLSYLPVGGNWGIASYVRWSDEKEESEDHSFTTLNNFTGPAAYSDAFTVIDLTAFYNFSDNLSVSGAIHNLTDEDYVRWEVINYVREGDGGFFSGVNGNGVDRFSEPGRSVSVRLSYKF